MPICDQNQLLVAVSYVYLGAREVSLLGPDLSWAKVSLPITLGYQAVGRLVRADSRFSWPAGQPVFLSGFVPCDGCEHCRRGATNLCMSRALHGINVDGYAAEFVCAARQAVFPVSNSIPEHLVPAMSEVGTALRALRRTGGAFGKRVAVVGGGDIGLTAGVLARIGGAAEVVVVDPDARARARAEEILGASSAVLPADLQTGEMDVVIEASGAEAGVVSAIRAAGDRGTVVLLSALGRTEICFASFYEEVVARELTILASRGKSRDELAVAAELLATKPLLQQIFELNPIRTLDEAPAILSALLKRELCGPVPIAVQQKSAA